MIVLASASPRRRVLLEEAGVDFRIDPADVDETVDDAVSIDEVARHLARRKALAVVGRYGPGVRVIGADTIVAVPSMDGANWSLLGKPSSPAEAKGMLRSISNTRHRVMTGVCVARSVGPHGEVQEVSGSETTWVSMRPIAEEEIEAYVASEEWRGKAGGYAIQENADRFVTLLEEGGFDNVVGLPVALTLDLLAECE